MQNYYETIFNNLVSHYNARVLEQKAIVDLAKEEAKGAPLTLTKEQVEKIVQGCLKNVAKKPASNDRLLFNRATLTTKKADAIIRFYFTDERERLCFQNNLNNALLRRTSLPTECIIQADGFLAAVSELPKELVLAS